MCSVQTLKKDKRGEWEVCTLIENEILVYIQSFINYIRILKLVFITIYLKYSTFTLKYNYYLINPPLLQLRLLMAY